MSYTDKLIALSNSIKAKNPNYTGNLSLAKMKEAVDGISSGVDASVITATAADCLNTKKILLADGSLASGTIATKSGVTTTLSKSTTSYTIPVGYYSSTGKVSITTQTKTVTPSSSSQSITADSGKVLTAVTVNAKQGKNKYTGSVNISSESYSISIPLGMTYSSSNHLYIYKKDIGRILPSFQNSNDRHPCFDTYFVACNEKYACSITGQDEDPDSSEWNNGFCGLSRVSISISGSSTVTVTLNYFLAYDGTPYFKPGTYYWVYFA